VRGVDAGDASAGAGQRPDAAGSDGDPGRAALDGDGGDDPVAARVDPHHPVRERGGDPDAARAVGDGGGPRPDARGPAQLDRRREQPAGARIDAKDGVVGAARDPDRAAADGDRVDRVAAAEVVCRAPSAHEANEAAVLGVRPHRLAVDRQRVRRSTGEQVGDVAGSDQDRRCPSARRVHPCQRPGRGLERLGRPERGPTGREGRRDRRQRHAPQHLGVARVDDDQLLGAGVRDPHLVAADDDAGGAAAGGDLGHEPVRARVDRAERVGRQGGDRRPVVAAARREQRHHARRDEQQRATHRDQHGRPAPPRRRPVPPRPVQRRVLGEDRPLKRLQLGPRLDPELVEQVGPRLRVLLERLRLPPGPVQRQHQLAAWPLPARVGSDELAQPRDDGVDLSERQLGVQQVGLTGGALLVEPARGVLGERGVAEVGEGIAAPQRQRRVERDPCRCRVAPLERRAAGCREGLEASAVQLAVLEPQQVAGGGRLDPVGAERAPEP
jgi:hypothetical protein